MANIDSPHGFKPLGKLLRVTKYDVDVANTPTISHNDFVSQATDGNCLRLSSETLILGSVVWIKGTDGVPLKHLPTTTAATIGVADHPDQEFTCQVNGTYADTARAANANITDAAGDSTTGISNQELDYGTIATTAALHVKINRLLVQLDNAVGADANVVVTINQHQRSHGDGSTGLEA